MKKIYIFYGPKKEFEKRIPTSGYKNLTEVVMEIDADTRILRLRVNEHSDDEKQNLYIKDFVIESSEYGTVKEHVIQNFINFISKFEVENIYIHNPPLQISRQVLKVFKQTEVENFKYKNFNFEHLEEIAKSYSNKIIGQDSVKEKLLTALFPLTRHNNCKPVVLLFYGDTGIGKTETAKFLSQVVGEELFRKQFSMFQNTQAVTYLFGGAHWENSFAKELLDRESNVILLDEFDKAHSSFHSAFYQLFDEGVYEDTNYQLEIKNAIIICTSNYKSENEIKMHLGEAFFSRFDAVISFEKLSLDVKKKIITVQFDRFLQELSIEEKDIVLGKGAQELLLSNASRFNNAREIEKVTREVISRLLINSKLKL